MLAKASFSLPQLSGRNYKATRSKESMLRYTRKHRSKNSPGLKICLLLPITTADCDRAFSTMRRAKSQLRSEMSDTTQVVYTLPVQDSIMKLLWFRERHSISACHGNTPAFVLRVMDPRTKPLGFWERCSFTTDPLL